MSVCHGLKPIMLAKHLYISFCSPLSCKIFTCFSFLFKWEFLMWFLGSVDLLFPNNFFGFFFFWGEGAFSQLVSSCSWISLLPKANTSLNSVTGKATGRWMYKHSKSKLHWNLYSPRLISPWKHSGFHVIYSQGNTKISLHIFWKAIE